MKRRLLIAAVFLLAGAVVNVAVAWGCCMFGQPSLKITQGVSRSDQEWLSTQFPYAREWRPLFTMIQRGFGDEYRGVKLMDEDGRPGGHVRGIRTRAGWPCFSLAYSRFVRMQLDPPRQGKPNHFREADSKSFGLIKLPAWLSTHYGYTSLPANVLWPGFLLNTIFYAAVLWLLIPGPFVLRRFIRMKRGRCVKCGYPMGESDVCSECGKALPKRAKVAT